ncbi:MAG: ChbG/HpnK family deacetylase [Planctomycetota bacterium]
MTTAPGTTQLIVVSDDFGMCHSINAGIVQAFNEGILTQSTLMVPCPWFCEAAELAKRHCIPVGIHYTLTCEWDNMRWGPLTRAPSLMTAEGYFHSTIKAVRAAARHDEVVAELAAQTDRLLATGLVHTHQDHHMGSISVAAYDEMTRRYEKRSIWSENTGAFPLTSILMLSDRDASVKKAWLLDQLANLTPGVHLLVGHCGQAGAELSSLTPGRAWGEPYRVADLAVLIDPDIRAQVDRHGIRLRSFADVEFAIG